MTGPLTGVTVVAVEQAVAGPIATRHLADLGARVIKIERPGTGDFARDYDDIVLGQACHFVWLNRNKESVEIDIGSSAGRNILEELLCRADVFLQNIGPGSAQRLGLTADAVTSRHPHIVAVEISGFGVDGPYAGQPAYDLIVQAETGSIAITGRPGVLAKPGVAIADIGVGMYAYSTILAALYERRASGRGRAIRVNMFDTLIEWMAYSLYFARYSNTDPQPFGIGTQAIVPYAAYQTADDRLVVLGVQNEREWERFVRDILDQPEMLEDSTLQGNANRVKNRTRVDAACAQAFATMTLSDALVRLDRARISHAAVRSVSEVLGHPHLVERDRSRRVDTPAGPIDAYLPPFDVDGWTPSMGPVPALGEHTAPILHWLGYSETHIEQLADDAIIGSVR